MEKEKLEDIFFALVRSGLWEQTVCLPGAERIDFDSLYALAEEQSVIGLVAAALEHLEGRKVVRQDVIPFLKEVVALENRNLSMNRFVTELWSQMEDAGLHPLLVKGQGIAQCYERPFWRAAGDIDILVSVSEYEKTKALLISKARSVEKEGSEVRHQGMTIGSWPVEVHGTLRCGLSVSMDIELDTIQSLTFEKRLFRSWNNGGVIVNLPSQDSDVVFVFTHFLKHFYKEGLGLRQICDWCRLLWTYRDSIDRSLLARRLRDMGLMNEWQAFGAFAAAYLGMPLNAIPLYEPSANLMRKARYIKSFVLHVGNFGHNRDNRFYRYPYLLRKSFSFLRRLGDVCRHARIFPFDSFRFLPSILFNGFRSAAKGE